MAQEVLTHLKEHPDAWTRVDTILEFSQNMNTKVSLHCKPACYRRSGWCLQVILEEERWSGFLTRSLTSWLACPTSALLLWCFVSTGPGVPALRKLWHDVTSWCTYLGNRFTLFNLFAIQWRSRFVFFFFCSDIHAGSFVSSSFLYFILVNRYWLKTFDSSQHLWIQLSLPAPPKQKHF